MKNRAPINTGNPPTSWRRLRPGSQWDPGHRHLESSSCYCGARRVLMSHLSVVNPNRKIFEARKHETAALGAGEKLVLGHPLAATIGDSARCMQNLEKVLFTGPKTSDTVTFICD